MVERLKRWELQIASAIGPATGEQLEEWAAEHDRIWNRKAIIDRAVWAAGLICLIGMVFAALLHLFSWLTSLVELGFGVPTPPAITVVSLVVSGVFCVAIARGVWSRVAQRLESRRPVNPYRPIKVTPDDLHERNANFPVALAYLDAIRHQRRSIVPRDLDVLAMIRQQQQSNQGA
ncbi:hypothetical protein [Burkholderia ubonensis]|uniref:hypothetical protein n=1 Tax=Burkholderia ubonensis TaxID=101571 RepID=UPI00075862E5|nr:hypothetical protein [Burkholderia ubonensis]KVL70351.1 hypothetical protein WJ49_22840 [Burkholderia ubonensis]KVL73214.1 hypothetical protein WJ48_00535 [Burkholderia ubonensis]KVL91042.1 hypothetical protein WJ50_12970 [Burkholderia ubonensis]